MNAPTNFSQTMGKKPKVPVTAALRTLRQSGVAHSEHLYPYEEHGGSVHAAHCLDIDLHQVVKTLVFEDDKGQPLLVLMHGDRDVAVGLLARAVGAKRVEPCTPDAATKHTGYLVGGTSPFGTRKQIPTYAEATIRSLPIMYVNGGKRGFLVGLQPAALDRILTPCYVAVSAPHPSTS